MIGSSMFLSDGNFNGYYVILLINSGIDLAVHGAILFIISTLAIKCLIEYEPQGPNITL